MNGKSGVYIEVDKKTWTEFKRLVRTDGRKLNWSIEQLLIKYNKENG